MRTVLKYVADDDTEHATIESAERWNKLQNARRAANAILGDDRPDEQGRDYIQHASGAVKRFIAAIGDCLEEFENPKIATMWRTMPRGTVGLYLDENNSPFRADYCRLRRIDKYSREWAQGCYVDNPPRIAMPKDRCGGTTV